MKRQTRQRAEGDSSRLPVDRSQWSESSQRSYTMKEFYQTYTWTCRGCNQDFVWTAQEQKQAYEVEQVYIQWHPVLCEACAQKKDRAAEAILRYEKRWRTDKDALQQDKAFLKEWLNLLETYAQLGGGRNDDMIQTLRRLIRA